MYKNIRGALFGFVTKHACDRQTDRQTDGWTELRQLIPCKHSCSHGNEVSLTYFRVKIADHKNWV